MIEYKITPQILLKHFKLPYALTCDSVQGLTRNEPTTIFDADCAYVDFDDQYVCDYTDTYTSTFNRIMRMRQRILLLQHICILLPRCIHILRL